jgi:hypothetical protein
MKCYTQTWTLHRWGRWEYKILVENFKEKDHLRGQGVDGRIIIKETGREDATCNFLTIWAITVPYSQPKSNHSCP